MLFAMSHATQLLELSSAVTAGHLVRYHAWCNDHLGFSGQICMDARSMMLQHHLSIGILRSWHVRHIPVHQREQMIPCILHALSGLGMPLSLLTLPACSCIRSGKLRPAACVADV